MGACAVISGVIVSPAGISGPAPGLRSFVGSFVRWFVRSLVLVVVVDATICIADMHHRYASTIWCDDMHRRYASTICKAGKQKRPRACCSWPLMVYVCDSLLLFSDPLDYLTHISGNNPSNKILELH